jgi:dihydroxyacid dehydratase/phosphogluconate dehydratase
MAEGLARGLTNYGDRDFALYLRRSFARSMGYSSRALARPVIGIANSASGFNNCHRHFPELLEALRRGVPAPGGTTASASGPAPTAGASGRSIGRGRSRASRSGTSRATSPQPRAPAP